MLVVILSVKKVGPVRISAVGIMLFGALVLLRSGTSAFQPAAFLALAAESTMIK